MFSEFFFKKLSTKPEGFFRKEKMKVEKRNVELSP